MLEVRSLSCRRGGRLLFRNLGLLAGGGQAVALRGPNGCGKSSLLRLLAGLLDPAEGEILWQGNPIKGDPFTHRERLCLIGHAEAVKPELTVRENVERLSILSGASSVAETVLSDVGLNELAAVQARRLSAGQKKRLGLTRLLMRPAPLWLLDEPAVNLDAAGRAWLIALIERHCRQGGIAVIASHDDFMPQAQCLSLGAA